MEHKRIAAGPLFAILMALVEAALIFYTLHRELPGLEAEFQIPFPQIITQAAMWYKLAEVMFHSAGLIMVYGLISLVFPRLQFVLQLGAALFNLSGIPYLFSYIMSLRSTQHATNFQMAIIMFILCMTLPFLVMKLIGVVRPKAGGVNR